MLDLACTDALWKRKNECGLDGVSCRPFANSSFAFRCPANCAGVMVLNPRPVGALDVVYRPWVIGDGLYRGDSFICGSAIHAGVVSGSSGGCGRIERAGRRDNFPSSARSGIVSIPFDSYFPLSFAVSADPLLPAAGQDFRLGLLAVSVSFTTIFSLLAWSPAWQFFTIFTVIFAHVGLVSDPPDKSSPDSPLLPDRASKFFERFLPAVFCAVVLYWTCVKQALSGLRAQLDKTVLWLGGFWYGAMSNYTFGWLPIQRLTAHDLEQQPGAKAALAVILLVLAAIVAQQVYCFWLEGRLRRYLALYGVFVAAILLALSMPGLQLRLHHYVIGLLLLPGTSMQTRPSLLYQGILLGLFVNGIARWGFDSILQTPQALREDAGFESLRPVPSHPLISTSAEGSSISFVWQLANSAGFDGVSALVNDVERSRAFFADNGGRTNLTFSWTRPAGLLVVEYFRFAYVKAGVTLDYTSAGTWFSNRTWSMAS